MDEQGQGQGQGAPPPGGGGPNRTRGRLKKLVFGSLITGGAIGLAGVNAQAHGNASSHANSPTLQWSFDNYAVHRQEWFAANPANSMTLQDRILDRLVAGDTKAAVALIEGAGPPAVVMRAYIQAQLDLQKQGASGNRSTAKYSERILEISLSGVRYFVDHPIAGLEGQKTLGALLHNVASFMQPDAGGTTAEQVGAGLRAARQSLAIRSLIGDAAGTGRAEYMLGIYAFQKQDYPLAVEHLQASLERLREQPGTTSDVAWSKAFLGLSQTAAARADLEGKHGKLKGASLTGAKKRLQQGLSLVKEARTSFDAQHDTFAVGYLDSLASH
jgi:hypothetical protein